jgi:hypothetical protein
MSKANYGERSHPVPMLEPQDLGSTTTATDVVFLTKHHRAIVYVAVGAITGNAVVYLRGCDDAVPTTPAAIATWKYRLTSARGTDNVGAITAGSASGITLTDGTDENKVMVIYVEGEDLNNAGYPAFDLNIDPGSVLLVGVVADLEPRYPQNAQLSAVAA